MLLTGRIPKHIGIIMDGNGRWAASRGLGVLHDPDTRALVEPLLKSPNAKTQQAAKDTLDLMDRMTHSGRYSKDSRD